MHITIAEYGQALGITSARLTVSEKGRCIKEYPLNRLKTITVSKGGVSISSNLVTQCALRGIKLFVMDYRPQGVVCLQGSQQHAVVKVRQHQFNFLADNDKPRQLSRKFISGKIRNQRAVLKYFGKYSARDETIRQQLENTAGFLGDYEKQLRQHILSGEQWRSTVLGYEGQSARMYWQTLQSTALMPESFTGRTGRNARDIANQLLNYGYAILTSYLWHCIINAGLEAFAGCLHVERPGKPSLVLDLMEEYRPWVVDRNVIKLREQLSKKQNMDVKLKRQMAAAIHKTFDRKYLYKNKKLRLETIVQRQVYRLAGEFAGEKTFRPYLFRW